MAKIEKDNRLFDLLFARKFHENENQPLFSSKGFFEKLAIIADMGPTAADKSKSDLPEDARHRIGGLAGKLSTVFAGMQSWDAAFGAETEKRKRDVGTALRYLLIVHPSLPKQENKRLVNDVIGEYEEIAGIRLSASRSTPLPPQAVSPQASVQNRDVNLPPKTAPVAAKAPTPDEIEFDRIAHPPIPLKGAIEKFLTEPRQELGNKPIFANISAMGRVLQSRSTSRFAGNMGLMKAHDAVVEGLKEANEFTPQGRLFSLIVDTVTSRVETSHADKPAIVREETQKALLAAFREAVVKQFPDLTNAFHTPLAGEPAPQSFGAVKRDIANGSAHPGSSAIKNLIYRYFSSYASLAKIIAPLEGLQANSITMRLSEVVAHNPRLIAPGYALYSQIEKAARHAIPAKAEEFLEKLKEIAVPLDTKRSGPGASNGRGRATPSSNGTDNGGATNETYDAKETLLEKDQLIAALRGELAVAKEQLAARERENAKKDKHIAQISLELQNNEVLLRNIRTASAEALDRTSRAQESVAKALTKGNGKAQQADGPAVPAATMQTENAPVPSGAG